ncbi:MAG: YbhB/YbcL family Raf kinase inhibitor-like protein [Planctomycetota bacterium]
MPPILQSPAFANGERIPERYAHPPVGQDIAPPLQWKGLPQGTGSLALLCEDPDAPTEQPFVHLVAWGIPVDRQELVENEAQRYAQGVNDFGQAGWGGPLPPEGHGQHRYHFRLFALDATPELKPGASKADLLAAVDGHVLGVAETVGWYER